MVRSPLFGVAVVAVDVGVDGGGCGCPLTSHVVVAGVVVLVQLVAGDY